MSAPLKQNQGPTIAMILAEPRTQDTDVVFITHVGAMKRRRWTTSTNSDGGKENVQIGIDTEIEIFFEAHDAIKRNPIKLLVYEIPTAFDSTSIAIPSRQHGNLQNSSNVVCHWLKILILLLIFRVYCIDRMRDRKIP